jgi:phosphatidylserine decarboxylase
MFIHREGYTTLFVTLVVLALLNGLIMWAFPEGGLTQKIVLGFSLLIYLVVLQFFRNPSRSTPADENNIIAPADGKVVVIEEVEESEYYKGKRRQISIFMSPFNVHVNRNAVSGTVKYFKYHPGKYLVAWHPKSSTENERTTMVVETPQGQSLLMRQIAGALARRICWYVKPEDRVMRGEQYGFIKFGSRVDIFLPLDAKVNVQIGQTTTGGETIIATWS